MANGHVTSDVEVWKPVVGYESAYEVSSHGRVRSQTRLAASPRGKPLRIKGRMLSPRRMRGGYLSVVLALNGHAKKHWIHRMVLEAFVGPRPDGMECGHTDHNPANNHVVNLRWVTHSENMRATIAAGRRVMPRGHEHSKARLTTDDVCAVRRRVGEGTPQCAIAKELGVAPTTISAIVRRATWRHI